MNSLILLKISLILFVCDQAACAESPMCKTIICPKNEVFSQSANTCQPTCFGDEFKNNSLGCTEGKGCVCKEGFIRDPRTFNCIAKKSCPKKASDTTCPTNEVYSKDGAGCQLSCSTQNIAIKCMTRSGCKCRDGFIRDDITGQCISKRSCSNCRKPYSYLSDEKKCVLDCNVCDDPNEEYSNCGSRCGERGCNSNLRMSMICPAVCVSGCFCKKDYYRDEIDQWNTRSVSARCVKKEKCTKCPRNEAPGLGNPMCEKTCSTINDECRIFILRPELKCYCNEGYARVSKKNPTCVPIKDCRLYFNDEYPSFSDKTDE